MQFSPWFAEKWPAALPITALILFWVFAVILPTNAEEHENTICIADIADEVAEQDALALEFLDQHYKSEEPASNLLDGALDKFKEYSENTWNLFFNHKALTVGRLTAMEFEEVDACRNYVEEHLDTIELVMVNQNLTNASSKKTYTLVKKLQDINDGLRGLNEDFAHMYGAFKTFHDKFPGYIPK